VERIASNQASWTDNPVEIRRLRQLISNKGIEFADDHGVAELPGTIDAAICFNRESLLFPGSFTGDFIIFTSFESSSDLIN